MQETNSYRWNGRNSNNELPLVSIVTPSFNHGKFLERTIRSVLAQEYPRIEYIVVDGNSKDETVNILKKYDRYITTVIREPDSGQANAINKGFKKANGQILAWLNSDDCYSSASAVSQAVAFLSSQPDCDLVYGRRKYIDTDGYLVLIRPYREFSYDALKLSGYIPQECCFWTRELYDRAGGYIDETYDFAMDYELWMRMLKHGANIRTAKEYYGLYRLHPEAKSVAQFETVGLKEIARVQTEYADKALEPPDMYSAFLDYYAGFDRASKPRVERIRSLLWSAYEKAVRTTRFLPLDNWTFGRDARLIQRDDIRIPARQA